MFSNMSTNSYITMRKMIDKSFIIIPIILEQCQVTNIVTSVLTKIVQMSIRNLQILKVASDECIFLILCITLYSSIRLTNA